MKIENLIKELRNNVEKEKKVVAELNKTYNKFIELKGEEEKKMLSSQIKALKKNLHETNQRASRNLKSIYLTKPLAEKTAPKKPVTNPSPVQTQPTPEKTQDEKVNVKDTKNPKRKKLLKLGKNLQVKTLEKESLKRAKKQEKKVKKTIKRKPKKYAKMANKLFAKKSAQLLDKKIFQSVEKDLIKANMQYTPTTYVSMIYFSTFLSVFAGLALALFFLFFKVSAELPIITLITGDLGMRALKVFWLIIAVPIITFFLMYFYPSLEKKSTAHKIDNELPFAAINMAAISGSLINPSKIFNIIITTKEYPSLAKEFTKIMNEINIHGYNFVSALRKGSANSPSKRLSELFSGLATTINSGGDLPNFFEERAKTLLFDHRLEMEKQAKSAETFMDIYISLVVAAPMILMLLLIMMKISGLGVGFSTGTITLIMVLGVSIINIIFLTFLEMKKK